MKHSKTLDALIQSVVLGPLFVVLIYVFDIYILSGVLKYGIANHNFNTVNGIETFARSIFLSIPAMFIVLSIKNTQTFEKRFGRI